MKAKLLFSILSVVSIISALSDSPSYKPASAQGTTSAEVIFPADPVLQIRVVGAIGSSDKASSVFSFRAGGPPSAVTVASTNLSATNLHVGRHVGFSPHPL